MTAIAFVAVAALATLLRAFATAAPTRRCVPWRTLAVNVSGSLALGVIVAADWWTNPVIVSAAGLGSFTTLSTVAAESAALIDDDHLGVAIAYVGLTVIVAIAAAWLGLSIGGVL